MNKENMIIVLLLLVSILIAAPAMSKETPCGENVETKGSFGQATISIEGTIHKFGWYRSGRYGLVMCLNEKVLKSFSYFSISDPSNPLNHSKVVKAGKSKFYLQFIASATDNVIYRLVVAKGRVSNALAMQSAMRAMGFEEVSVSGTDATVGQEKAPE